MNNLKSQIIAQCREILEGKIKALESELHLLALDIAGDTKSSAGDKYETSREMANIEIGKLTDQLLENKNSLGRLLNLKPGSQKTVQAGSLVKTETALIFIAISLGLLERAGSKVMVISPNAPLAQALLGAKPGATVFFNNRPYLVQEVC